jgi:hypothetical protein
MSNLKSVLDLELGQLFLLSECHPDWEEDEAYIMAPTRKTGWS